MEDLKGKLAKEALVLSIVAGARIARIAKALAGLSMGLRVIGVGETETMTLVGKVATDCMPAIRSAVLAVLQRGGEFETTQVAEAIEYPLTTTRRTLEDLMLNGLVDRRPGGKGTRDHWRESELARMLRAEASPA